MWFLLKLRLLYVGRDKGWILREKLGFFFFLRFKKKMKQQQQESVDCLRTSHIKNSNSRSQNNKKSPNIKICIIRLKLDHVPGVFFFF